MPPTAASITSPTDPPSTAAISASLSIRISSCFEVVLLLAITFSSVSGAHHRGHTSVRRCTKFSVLFPRELRNENGADLGKRRFTAAADALGRAERDPSHWASRAARLTRSIERPHRQRRAVGAVESFSRHAVRAASAHEAEKDRSDGAGASAHLQYSQARISLRSIRATESYEKLASERLVDLHGRKARIGASHQLEGRRHPAPRTLHRAVVVGGLRRGRGCAGSRTIDTHRARRARSCVLQR